MNLSWLQHLGLGKGLQLFGGFVCSLVVWSRDVEFHNLLAIILTRILNGDRHVVDIVLLGNLGIAILEGGIAEAEAEGIAYGHFERVEVAIAHVDVLLVVGIVNIFLVTLLALVHHVDFRIFVDGEVLRRVGIGELNGPCHRELA